MITNQPRVAIICPITRGWGLDKLFSELDDLICEREKTDLIFYIDTGNRELIKKVNSYKGNFNKIKVEISGNPSVPNFNISRRRDRITEGKEDSKRLIDHYIQYVMGIEDDCRIPKDAMQRLLPPIMRADIGFVQGVQVGRWARKYVGAWRLDNLENPTKIISMPYDPKWFDGRNKYLENIDGGGFYCYMTKASLYKGASYRWQEPLGPDVWFGIDLKRQGYKCLIDWGLIIGHDNMNGVLYPDDKCEQVVYNKNSEGWELE